MTGPWWSFFARRRPRDVTARSYAACAGDGLLGLGQVDVRAPACGPALGDIHRARPGGRIPRAGAGRVMPQFRTTRRVRHSANEMFDLVADVERYPEFVPLCSALRVRKRTAEEGRETLVADMTVA